MIDRAIDEAITYSLDLELLLEPCESQEELDTRLRKAAKRQWQKRWTFDPMAGIVTDSNER